MPLYWVGRAWKTAIKNANGLEKDYSDSAEARAVSKRVEQTREDYKLNLERRFLEASQRDEIDLAMKLIKELDHSLTESETAPVPETTRGIIMQKRIREATKELS